MQSDEGSRGGSVLGASGGTVLEELRRRNTVAVGMDLLYLVTTGFFAHMFVRGFWPAVIAALPIGMLLYFGWNSSKSFFVAQVLTIAVTAAVTVGDVGLL